MNKFQKKRKHKINKEINYPNVRVVGDNIDPKILRLNDALNIASSMGLDLILISENANPPVTRIEEYNKFIYNQEKLEREEKIHQKLKLKKYN